MKTWWPGTESNRRRQPFQGCAQPLSRKLFFKLQPVMSLGLPASKHGRLLLARHTARTQNYAGLISTETKIRSYGAASADIANQWHTSISSALAFDVFFAAPKFFRGHFSQRTGSVRPTESRHYPSRLRWSRCDWLSPRKNDCRSQVFQWRSPAALAAVGEASSDREAGHHGSMVPERLSSVLALSLPKQTGWQTNNWARSSGFAQHSGELIKPITFTMD